MDTKILNTFLIGERSVGAEHTPDGGAHGRILYLVENAGADGPAQGALALLKEVDGADEP
jgi:hypothetical protein